MISVDSLLYKIDQKLNKLSTNEHQSIQREDKILALNEAQIKLIKQKVNGFSTPAGMGLESFRKRCEDLQNLIEDYNKAPLKLEETDKNLNQFSASLSEIPNYFFYIDSFVLADKGRCKDKKIWINRDLARHGDIQYLLNNNHYKPSFEYEETFNTLSTDKIHVYSDGTFTPKQIFISYLRYPLYIDKAGYVHLDGDASVDQDCELEDYLEDELVDLTVQNLAAYTENTAAIQSAQLRIQSNE